MLCEGWLGSSVGQRRGLGGIGFLPPLHQQRVRGILDFLDLDLFVVHPHGGQGTGHLLLWGGGTEPSAKAPPQGLTARFSSSLPSTDLHPHTQILELLGLEKSSRKTEPGAPRAAPSLALPKARLAQSSQNHSVMAWLTQHSHCTSQACPQVPHLCTLNRDSE